MMFSLTDSSRRRSALTGIALAMFTVAAGSASAAVAITSTSPLPNAASGVNYTFTFTATGGTSPYVWASSSLPPGLQLDSNSGILGGTPTQTGSFSFVIQVTDANKATATGNFSLTVVPGPLVITTLSPLFTAIVGSPYSQQFTATGGAPPYTWSVTQGQTGALTLNASTGSLSGTPTAPGVLNFTVQVKDSAGATFSASFSLTVKSPTLVISTSVNLPDGAVGNAYSQQLAADGGVPPYVWSLLSGAVPGLTLSSAGLLSNTPITPGTYTPTIQVTDSAGIAVSKVFHLTIAPAPLNITTASPLGSATAGIPFSQTLAATGGTPPYTWSATGLPAGLTIDAPTGTISGTPVGAGTFSVPIRVTDANRSTFGNLYTLTVALPTVPTIKLSVSTTQSQPANQIPVQIMIDKAYSGPISGQVSIAFVPAIQGATDPAIQFSSGGSAATFTIPAGQTTAVYSAQSLASLALATGTLAGTITLSAQVQAFGLDVTPQPAPTQSIGVTPSVPVISQLQLTTNGQTITIQIIGFSTTRELTQAAFNFGTSQGNATLQTAQFVITVGSAFSTWYKDPASNAFGSQFLYAQSFTVQGDASAVTLQTVALTNQVGSGSYTPAH